MSVVWEALGVITESNAKVQSRVKGAGTITINFKASDSALEGCMKIADGKITGGSTPEPKSDMQLSGETDILVGLCTGAVDPIKGFMTKKYVVKGKITLAMKMARVFTSILKALRES
jgi:putative sterol carrier protein